MGVSSRFGYCRVSDIVNKRHNMTVTPPAMPQRLHGALENLSAGRAIAAKSIVTARLFSVVFFPETIS